MNKAKMQRKTERREGEEEPGVVWISGSSCSEAPLNAAHSLLMSFCMQDKCPSTSWMTITYHLESPGKCRIACNPVPRGGSRLALERQEGKREHAERSNERSFEKGSKKWARP